MIPPPATDLPWKRNSLICKVAQEMVNCCRALQQSRVRRFMGKWTVKCWCSNAQNSPVTKSVHEASVYWPHSTQTQRGLIDGGRLPIRRRPSKVSDPERSTNRLLARSSSFLSALWLPSMTSAKDPSSDISWHCPLPVVWVVEPLGPLAIPNAVGPT